MDKFDDYLNAKSKDEKEKFVLLKSFDDKIESTLDNLDKFKNLKDKWYLNKKLWVTAACFTFIFLASLGIGEGIKSNKIPSNENSMVRSANYKDSQNETIIVYDSVENQNYNSEEESIEIILSDIPSLKISTSNDKIDAIKGYYTWINSSEDIDTSTVSDLVKASEILNVKPGEEINLDFTKVTEDYKVNLWNGNFDKEINYNDITILPYENNNLTFKAPIDLGGYIFEVIGKWNEGEVSYIFRLQVS